MTRTQTSLRRKKHREGRRKGLGARGPLKHTLKHPGPRTGPPLGKRNVFVFSDGKVSFEGELKDERCEGENEKGERCIEITCMHPPFCLWHMNKVLGLSIRPSLIPGAGRGLFAVRDFKKNVKLTPYVGEMLTKRELESRYGSESVAPYALLITNNKYIDSACVRGVGAYANAALKEGEANARLSVNKPKAKAWLVSTRKIVCGEEIIIDYGESYWKGTDKATHHTIEDPDSEWKEWWARVPKYTDIDMHEKEARKEEGEKKFKDGKGLCPESRVLVLGVDNGTMTSTGEESTLSECPPSVLRERVMFCSPPSVRGRELLSITFNAADVSPIGPGPVNIDTSQDLRIESISVQTLRLESTVSIENQQPAEGFERSLNIMEGEGGGGQDNEGGGG